MGAPSLTIAAREAPWYRLFLHTPLTTLTIFVIPYFVARCLERVRSRAVRLGILIGAGLGVPLSYFAQPVSVQTSMALPVYLIGLIRLAFGPMATGWTF